MSKKFYPTEEVTIRDLCISDGIERFNEEAPGIMLGTIIKPNQETSAPKPKKKKFKFKLSLDSLKTIKSSAVVSVRSLYQKMVITQKSITKKYWDVVMELILGYNVITTLYFLAYAYPGDDMLVVDFICWVLFIIDIGLTFFTELITEKGESIRKFSVISVYYIKGWLVPDVLAIIPLAAAGYPQAEYLLRMFRLIKLPGVLNITDGTGVSFLLSYFNFGKREKNGKISYPFTTRIIASLIQLFITIIFLVYFLGCFWFWFQHLVKDKKYSSEPPPSTDASSFEDYFVMTGISSEHIALKSSYYILTTIATIGYGDMMPRNVYEMGFIIIVMLSGVTIFAVIMGNFNSAISYYSEATNGSDLLGELNSWLGMVERIHGTIEKDLKEKIVQHFTYYFSKDRLKTLAKNYWEANSPEDLVSIDQEYIKDLPEDTYYEILESLFGDFLSNFSFYLGSSKFRIAVLPHLQPRIFNINEYISKNGESITEIVFVNDGNVSIGVNIYGKHKILLNCESGRTILGDYSVITRTPNKYDFLSHSKVHTFVMDSETFITILDFYYKSEKINILAIASQREKNLRRLLADHLKSSGLDQHILTEVTNKYIGHIPKHQKKADINDDEIEKDLNTLGQKSCQIEEKSKSLLILVSTTDELRSHQLSLLKRGL